MWTVKREVALNGENSVDYNGMYIQLALTIVCVGYLLSQGRFVPSSGSSHSCNQHLPRGHTSVVHSVQPFGKNFTEAAHDVSMITLND